jgi:multiple sugar transport system permease protein
LATSFPADFKPAWLGLRAIDLADTIYRVDAAGRIRQAVLEFHQARSAPFLALIVGSMAAYGLSRLMAVEDLEDNDISFFFLSQLILPPVVLAMPFLVLYKELALLDSMLGLILIYALSVLPIVIWIMKDQFDTIPQELEQAAMVDGCSVWGAFLLIILPIALPGMVAAFILSVILCWNEYFFAALLTSTNAKTLPVMVASQTGSQGISWWSMAALSSAAILPLIIIGVFLERYIVKGLTTGSVK